MFFFFGFFLLVLPQKNSDVSKYHEYVVDFFYFHFVDNKREGALSSTFRVDHVDLSSVV